MKLQAITIQGTMQASAWGCMLGDDTADMLIPFERTFRLVKRSPWDNEWAGLREALMEATESGDLIGGRGDIVEARIGFTRKGMAKAGRIAVTVESSYELRETPGTRDLWLQS
jgi:hypothetical protein